MGFWCNGKGFIFSAKKFFLIFINWNIEQVDENFQLLWRIFWLGVVQKLRNLKGIRDFLKIHEISMILYYLRKLEKSHYVISKSTLLSFLPKINQILNGKMEKLLQHICWRIENQVMKIIIEFIMQEFSIIFCY